MSSQDGSAAPPPTKRKIPPGKEQQLANARLKKQLVSTQKQLAGELLELAEIKSPIPDHMRLLQLCQLGVSSSMSTSELSEIGGFRFEIVKQARDLLADEICKKPGFSDDEIELHLSEVFKKYYSFAHKPGRKALDPIFMVAITLFIRQKHFVERDFDCTTTMEDFWAQIVLPCAKHRGIDVPELASSTQYAIFENLCPKVWRGKGKWAIKNRKAALLDPCGALTMAAAWPIIMKLVDPKCMVFWDKMSHLIGHDPPARCRVSKEIQELLSVERRSPTFTKGMSQERSFGITVGLQLDSGLLSCTFHICDETLTEIRHEQIGTNFHVMFEPYSAKSELRASGEQASGAEGEALSLALRTAGAWAEKVQIPAMKKHREKLQAEARECQCDPERFKYMVLSCDGEHSHLHNLLDVHAEQLALDNQLGIKLPAGHSGNTAVPDVAPIFPGIHRKLIRAMKQASADEVNRILSEEGGLNRVVLILMGLNGMSAESKETFKKALTLAYGIVKATVTVSAVVKGCKDACVYPFNREKMITRMWPAYSQITNEERMFVLATIDGPISDAINEHGWCKSTSVEMLIKSRETSIVFPPRSIDFDRFQWNRQSTVIFSHQALLAEHRRRVVAQVEHQEAVQQRILNKEEETQRILFRKRVCSVGTDAQSGKTKCGCGRLFDGLSGFKTHEKCAHHVTHYANRNWETEFTAAQVGLAPQAEAPPAGADGAAGA